MIIWDLSVALLIVFPLLTGGIWIQRPGLFLEISDLGASTLIIAALAVVLKFGFGQALERSRSIRCAESLWDAWQAALKMRPKSAVFSGALLVSSIWILAALRRHTTLDSHAFDLGIFTNAIWNSIHGYGLYSSVKGGMSLLADHQSPLFWFYRPFFALAPFPQTLIVLQAIGIALGALPVYFIARQFSSESRDSRFCAALPLLYWAYLPIRNATQFDFHPETLMLPLFLAAIAGVSSRRVTSRIFGFIAFAFALMAKESAGPIAAGIGLAWVLGAAPVSARRFLRGMGFAWIIIGVLSFAADIVLIPRLLGVSYAYGGLYSQYFTGFHALPVLLFHQLLGATRLKFLFWTLAPLGFLPFLNPRALVAALPAYLMLFLSAGDHRVDIHWHYGIEAAVGVFFAMASLSREFRKRAFLWLLFCALATFGRNELFQARRAELSPHGRWLVSEFLPCVDPSIPLAVSDALVPHLSTRHWILRTDFLWQSPRESVECVIYDSSVSNWPMEMSDESHLKELMKSWKPSYSCGSLAVWETGDGCLKCRPQCVSN